MVAKKKAAPRKKAKKKATRKKPHGNSHKPTAALREKVRDLSGIGLPHKMIGLIVGIDAKTLRKHYDADLELGEAKATAKIAKTLFARAVGGDLGAAIFWLKARAGWREKQSVEVEGGITVNVVTGVPEANGGDGDQDD